MSYVVHLYREGGDHDGETFACGPFTTLDEAQEEADELSALGQVTPLFLFAHAGAVERNAR